MRNIFFRKTHKEQKTFARSSVLFLFFLLFFLSFFLSSCTEYERANLNPRPFNEPAYWEINPYGANAFQN